MSKRYEFEKKNLIEPGAQSYKSRNETADIAFELSSEGEFQRIKFLIDDLLKDKDFKCELIFCSPSVETTILSLYEKYPDQIRYYRLTNLLRGEGFLKRWISAKTLIMVQYDFFPQLLSLRNKMEKMILISPKDKKVSFYKSWCFSFFDLFLTDQDSEHKIINSKKQIVGSLRELAILDRKNKAREVLCNALPWFDEFEKKVLRNSDRKIIFGNYWHDEFSNIDLGEVPTVDDVLVIVPHELDSIQDKKIMEDFLGVSRVTESEEPDYAKNVFLFSVKGILCELYQYFDLAYVGGGFKKNVHSLLEPFIAGCFCVCGENVNKSNEYKLIMEQDPQRIEISSNLQIEPLIEKTMTMKKKSIQSFNNTSWYREFKEYLSSTIEK